MKTEVLVAAMFKDKTLYKAMNLQTDAVIINQCGSEGKEIFFSGDKRCIILSYSERGIGNSRNRALDAASGDILLFADDDIRYVDGYERIVEEAFENNPNADAVIFNITVHGGERREVQLTSSGEMTYREALAFGAVRLAVKKSKIGDTKFSLLFGGGARYGSGEDTLFIQELFRRGLRVYKSTEVIADVSQEESSWFEGYTDRYFFDKGALYGALWGGRAKAMSVLTAARWCVKLRRLDYPRILAQYFKGIDDYRRYISGEI
jgi:glycosyltransferase involved in cell wall biosynthesis